jgi:hypothetical protein
MKNHSGFFIEICRLPRLIAALIILRRKIDELNPFDRMKRLVAISLCFGFWNTVFTGSAVDFKQSKLTQVVNDVQIISASNQSKKNAAVNDIFAMPDILRTGPASRAELVADDQTVTRVGANTIFYFDPANRTIDLQQGSLLFHSPHGQGGGTIHTGSATASVLGSTLIVTTTPNGGFKVLALEDEAEIKFFNGLRQKLEPGEMTFILPGGTQLAPIIVFRLDGLTGNSLLINGFNHPLPSLPLIVQEIDKQDKLINSGKLTDTGLDAGNNADPNQVEVLDANTIQSHDDSRVQTALAADATINQPSLTDATIPTPPTHLFLNAWFPLADNAFFTGQSFKGFAARNISFNTAGLDLLAVNLSPYVKNSEFDFVAANDLNLDGPVTFGGLSSSSTLRLVAGNQITFSPGVTLTANVADFELAAPGPMTLDGATILNSVGAIGLTSGSVINIADGVAISNPGLITMTAPVAVNITSDSDVDVGVDGAAIVTDSGSGSVTFSSSGGSVNVTDTSIQTHYLTLNSGDSILLDASGKSLAATGTGATANFTAPNIITVNNSDMSSFGSVNMAANTVNLFNVAFGAGCSVLLQSLNGLLAPNPNTSAASVPGDVNFIQNVTYAGKAAQNYVNNGGGITVTTLH